MFSMDRGGKSFADQGRQEDGRGMKKYRWLLMAALILLILSAAGAYSETGTETVTGYFTNKAYLRPDRTRTKESLGFIPAYTIVTLEKEDDTWGVYTSPDGMTGFVNCSRILPVPDYEKEPERPVYGDKKIEVRCLPNYKASSFYTAQPYELLTVDGHHGKFLHVVTLDGTEGYVMKSWIKKAEFRPKSISPIMIFVTEETPALDMPLRGAQSVGKLEPEEIYTAEAAFGDYYALTGENGIQYVEKARSVICSLRGGENRNFFTLPRTGSRERKGTIQSVLAVGKICGDGAQLRLPGGGAEKLPAHSLVYLYSACGDWMGAVQGNNKGYLKRRDVEILTSEGWENYLRGLDLSGGGMERNPFLDQAFTMVEEGNPFQARYNLLTGADTKSILPLGVPYFWGGRNYLTMTERLPLYTVREAWISSRTYYQKGTVYLYGLDCVGFVKTVCDLAGVPVSGSLTGRAAAEFCEAGKHVYCSDVHPLPEDWREAARGMQPGDVMVVHHPNTHVMMYMGTLRQYGYTGEQLPALAKYLDYPLMIQSGENPASYLRFRSMIGTSPDGRTAGATPPHGGAGVCILGVDPEDAVTVEYHETSCRCFEVEGSCVTLMSFRNVKDYFVYRIGKEDSDPRAATEGAGSPDEMEAAGDEPVR